jgi:Protein of unknown function (DUF3150)
MEMKAPNISIASMAMLVELRISTWTARKRDVGTTEDLNRAKNADSDAGSVYKYLMAGSDHLKKIEKYAAKCRAWNGQQTLPWMKGIGLLPMDNFFDYRQQLGTMESNFNALVNDFITAYPTIVSAQAFKLGDYFDASEFPDVSTLPRKFKFEYNFLPVPESGDFRLKCEEAVRQDLAEQYERMFNDRLAEAMRDPWDRLHDALTHIASRLTDQEGGERNIFRDSLINKPLELCSLLTKLNITNDPQLEEARRMLEKALSRADLQDLRDHADARAELKNDVQSIIGKFNW